MKNLIIIISVIIVNLSLYNPKCNQHLEQISDSFLRDTCIGHYFNNQKEGLWRCWYDNQYIEHIYHHGKLHGITKIYSDTLGRTLYYLQSYINGVQEGNQVSYYKNGKPHYITTYENNKHTYSIEYDTLGYLLQEGGYLLDSINNSTIIFDSETLEIVDEVHQKEKREVKHGTWKFYNPNGEIVKKYFYEKGNLIDSLILKF